MLQFASFSFDASVGEIFPALCAGAALIVRPNQRMMDVAGFVCFIEAKKLTVIDIPTSFWSQWVLEMQAGRNFPGKSLRTVIVGGEKVESRHLRGWLASPAGANCRWVNTYGPTEATVYATAIAFDRDTQLTQAEVPIGRPIGNTQIYVLDSQGQPAPIGVAGEIYIG